MIILPRILGILKPTGFLCKAGAFDGTDYGRRLADLTGNVNTKLLWGNFWFRIDGGDDTIRYIYSTQAGNAGNYIVLNAANKIVVVCKDASGNNDLIMISDTAYLAGAAWHHCCYEADNGNAVGRLYIDDADDLAAGATIVDDTLDVTQPDHAIGAEPDGSDFFDGDLAEVIIEFGEIIGINVEATRRKLISATGKPVNPGADGSLVSGNQPLVYLSLRPGDAASAFWTNRGSGGNFTDQAALTIAATSPSD